jgi:hypothetical protein
MLKYRKKPIEIEAAQWDGTAEGATPIIDWILANGDTATYRCSNPERCSENDGDTPHTIAIPTLEGTMHATVGDWIIRGVQGEFYPCKPDIFAATYDSVADAPQEATAEAAELTVEANMIEQDAIRKINAGALLIAAVWGLPKDKVLELHKDAPAAFTKAYMAACAAYGVGETR